MSWTIPGTVLTAPRAEADHIEEQFHAMFLPGGMVLSQVSGITGLESYIIQNWVKRGFLTKPQNKRYTLRQLCRIMNINMLKGVLPLERICHLLGYVNGELDNEQDDMIDDSVLYFMFVRLAAKSKELYKAESRDAVLDAALENYQEPEPGAKERVEKVLRTMLTAWICSRFKQQVDEMVDALK